jgi:hypothetical protein
VRPKWFQLDNQYSKDRFSGCKERVSYQELFLNCAQAVKTGLELKVVVGRCLGNGRDNSNPVALGADVVSGRNASNVDV